MKQAIFKYKVHLLGTQTVTVQIGFRPISVQTQGDDIQMWGIVDPDAKKEVITVEIYGTGQVIPLLSKGWERQYAGTVQKDGMVWHIFTVHSV